ncbi:MAG TPA: hypothetical protein VGV68_13115 [Terriglobia bacterium]|nr:hypothetical protein [Terriglobia bacterium]
MSINGVWLVALPLAIWMACEWWRREDYTEWRDWLEGDEPLEPSPLLNVTWELWLKLRPLYDWVSHQLYRPYSWAIGKGWVRYKPDENWKDWFGYHTTPEEMLLAQIEWDMDPTYTEIRATWQAYLKSRDDAREAPNSKDEQAA